MKRQEPESGGVAVIEEAERARSLLHPARRELLEALAEPSSAVELARRLDLPRQRVNYHLRELESSRLVELVEERRRGSVVERVYRRTATTFAISTQALGALGTDPDGIRDRFSSAFQVALASRAVDELGRLREGARAAGQKLPTFSLDVEVRFASPAERSRFASELAGAVAELVERYHDEEAPEGRPFRFFAGGYPKPKEAGTGPAG